MNTEKYPWLLDLDSPLARDELARARTQYLDTGAVVFANFLTDQALHDCVEQDAQQRQEAAAYTTNSRHTAYLKSKNTTDFDESSVYNYEMQTQVASIAFDELSPNGTLSQLYRNPILLQLVSRIVRGDSSSNNNNNNNNSSSNTQSQSQQLYLSDDPLGCCSINVFRPGYHHSFHFDESEFSTTIMLQEAEDLTSGLFQYTSPPIRGGDTADDDDDLCLKEVAWTIATFDERCRDRDVQFKELQVDQQPQQENESSSSALPQQIVQQQQQQQQQQPAFLLSSLDFRPGTLSIFSGSRSLHRVTTVRGNVSRLTAVLTFATRPGFCNSAAVQELFWGRSSSSSSHLPSTSSTAS
jgi:hypothetical protein